MYKSLLNIEKINYQITPDSLSENLKFKIFPGGGMPPDPPTCRALCAQITSPSAPPPLRTLDPPLTQSVALHSAYTVLHSATRCYTVRHGGVTQDYSATQC